MYKKIGIFFTDFESTSLSKGLYSVHLLLGKECHYKFKNLPKFRQTRT
jgi:hypothetical protein